MWKHLTPPAATLCVLATLAPGTTRAAVQDLEPIPRLETSSERLHIKWRVFTPKTSDGPLDATAALAALRSQDQKPILILRDCDLCGADDATLEKSLGDERIRLATHWFRCVRVGRGVTEPTHPVCSLFAGPRPPHIVIFSSDGTLRIEVSGKSDPKLVYRAMDQVLRRSYQKPADAALTGWIRLLARFDTLDFRRAALAKKREASTDGRKAVELDKKLSALEAEIEKALDEEQRITDLELEVLPTVAAPPPVDRDAEAAEAVSRARSRPSVFDKMLDGKEGKDGKERK